MAFDEALSGDYDLSVTLCVTSDGTLLGGGEFTDHLFSELPATNR